VDIERTIMQSDNDELARDVRTYRSRVAVARVGMQEIIDNMQSHPLSYMRRIVPDLKRIASILDGDLISVHAPDDESH